MDKTLKEVREMREEVVYLKSYDRRRKKWKNNFLIGLRLKKKMLEENKEQFNIAAALYEKFKEEFSDKIIAEYEDLSYENIGIIFTYLWVSVSEEDLNWIISQVKSSKLSKEFYHLLELLIGAGRVDKSIFDDIRKYAKKDVKIVNPDTKEEIVIKASV